MRIIVVDDDPYQTFTVKKTLEDLGDEYEVIRADSGRQCLELLRNNELPDLILLDIMMPEMSGWEAFKKIKENPLWKKIPIVFITARTDEIAKNAGDFLGEDYIEKPYDATDLKERINKVLKKHRSETASSES